MESDIDVILREGVVVWKLDPDVAAFYAEDVLAEYHHDHPADEGVKHDLKQLRDAIELLEADDV